MNPRDRQNSPIFKSFHIIYPVFVYFVAINLSMSLFTMLAVFLGADPKEQYMSLQTASVAVTVPFIARYYQKDRNEPTVFWEHMELVIAKKSTVMRALNGILMFLAGAAVGFALNNLLIVSGLEDISQGYQEVNEYLFSGGIFLELLGACLLTPFLEELLYRGVVYGRLCDLMILDNEEKTSRGRKRERQSRALAMILSALLFGVIHMNLVQFAYAGLLGILLAWFMEKTGHFYGAFLAHMGANLMAVIRVKTPIFSWMKSGTSAFYAATLVASVAGIVLIAAIQFALTGRPQKREIPE